MSSTDLLACPCCGWRTLSESYGSYDICPICFWEDDIVQLHNLTLAGGANRVCLVEAQRSYEQCGASEARFLQHVRRPALDETRDPVWRPVDLARDGLNTSTVESNIDYFHASAATYGPPYWTQS